MTRPGKRTILARVDLRPHLLLPVMMLLLTGGCSWAQEQLTDEQREDLARQLEKIRSTSDTLLQMSPLEHIGEIGPMAVQASLHDLVPLLDSPDPELRRAVLRLLVPPVVLDQAQIARITRMQADPDDQSRTLVHDLLAAASQARAAQSAQAAMSGARGMDDAQLLLELAKEDLGSRERAGSVVRERLGDAGHRIAYAGHAKDLAALARSPDGAVRQLALEVLARCVGVISDDAAAAAIADLQDDNAKVVDAAIDLLGQVGPAARAEAEPAVRAFVEDTTVGERPRALRALAGMGAWKRRRDHGGDRGAGRGGRHPGHGAGGDPDSPCP